MQNESTSNLQQQKGDLQQGTPNLQQSGTPTSTLNTSSVLSNAAPQGNLQVSTTAATSPSTVQPDVAQPSGNDLWLLLLIIPFVLVVSIFWPRKELGTEIVAMAQPEPMSPAVETPAKKTAKPKKKSHKRKKSGRR